MKVAVDTSFLANRYQHTGTGVYLRHLLHACLNLCESDLQGTEFHCFSTDRENWAQNGFCSEHMQVHQTRLMAKQRAWCFGGMAIATARIGADLLFLPTVHGGVASPFTPLIATILDTMPKRLPRHSLETSRVAHQLTWLNARLARMVITISQWSKLDIIDIYGLAPEKVQVTYLGYDKTTYNTASVNDEHSAAVLELYGIRRPFVLHHGMVQRRKNLGRLIQAWDCVLRQNRSFDAQLVLAGPMGLGHEEVLRLRDSVPDPKKIILTGPVPEADLAVVIKNASLSVIPSLYEGFCLPMVESMACGVPTIASNSSCLPEVSGGVLEYFDPLSIEEMSHTIRRALEDSELRGRLRRVGLARASEYSWERCARETLQLFTETAAVAGRTAMSTPA